MDENATETEDIKIGDIKEILEGECSETPVELQLKKAMRGLGENPIGNILAGNSVFSIFRPENTTRSVVVFRNNLAGMEIVTKKKT